MPLSEEVGEADMIDLVLAGPLRTRDEVADFLDGTDEERALIIDNARLCGIASVVSSWDKFLAVLNATMAVAGVVTGITSAVTGVYAVKAVL